jgi:hypothetical protein
VTGRTPDAYAIIFLPALKTTVFDYPDSGQAFIARNLAARVQERGRGGTVREAVSGRLRNIKLGRVEGKENRLRNGAFEDRGRQRKRRSFAT